MEAQPKEEDIEEAQSTSLPKSTSALRLTRGDAPGDVHMSKGSSVHMSKGNSRNSAGRDLQMSARSIEKCMKLLLVATGEGDIVQRQG